MAKNIVEKILSKHIKDGSYQIGEPVEVKIDQTLTQDATGTMAYMQFEQMGLDQVQTDLSVSYVDHNTLQNGFMNADDHAYLQSVASKYGIQFSKPGNGICHQVHLERFARPGATLIGSDSHTPTAGAMGMLAFGAGGLDVAKAMAGLPYTINYPKVVKVELKGKLRDGAAAKDIILELLRRRSVKGGVGTIFEYGGEGLDNLSVYQRATITNMGAELGATTSVFPSDEKTLEFLTRQNRAEQFEEIKADEGAHYDEIEVIDLDQIVPAAAAPNSPDAVVSIEALEGMPVDQVSIGSCTNSGFEDLVKAAQILKGNRVADTVSLTLSPGSRQVLNKLIDTGYLKTFIEAGARILENTCGPCIGMGQSPKSDGVSLRTFNRNFYGRSGTNSAKVYLVSPETAAYSAIKGVFADPSKAGIDFEEVTEPVYIDDSMILAPSKNPESVEIVRGPNIKPLPKKEPMADTVSGKVSIKVEDNITTDDIAPAGAEVLPYRSNVEKLSTYVFKNQKPGFADHAKELGTSFIVAGDNYGQGSSREHAALAPMYLGVQGVLAKSFARIHLANLINFGLLPLQFENPQDYDDIDEGDELVIVSAPEQLKNELIQVENRTKNHTYNLIPRFASKDIDVLKAGGTLNYIRSQNQAQA